MSNPKRDIANELHKPARKIFPRRRTIVKGLGDLYQCDLMEFIPYARENKGNKYILIIIDCFSKYVWTHPLKNKTALEVTNAMQNILKSISPPRNLQVDDGKEFWNKSFLDLCKKYKINLYSTFSPIKASMVERVIRTIKNLLYKEFSFRGQYKWIDILQEITSKYNSTKHSTTGLTPKEGIKKKNERKIKLKAFTHLKIAGRGKFHVNDKVRISKYKTIFAKGYTPNWSTEIFNIKKIQFTNPITYILEDEKKQPVLGAFYEYELQRVKHPDIFLVEKVIKRKGKRAFVKFLGFDNTHNAWVTNLYT